jgi:hypothetical protein
MESWGNGRANAYYEAKMPSGYAKPGENDPVRVVERFIRDKYEHKKFVGDSIPEAGAGSTTQQDQDVSRRQSRAAPAAKPSTERAREAPLAPAAPQVQVAKTEPNLLDFFDEPAPVAPAPAVQPQRAFADPFGGGGAGGFGQSFQDSQQVHPPSSDPFFSNSTPTNTTPTHQQPPVAQKPMASNDAILSLFSSGSSNGTPQQQGHGMQGGGGFGISTMPPPQSHMSGMMPPVAPMMGHHVMQQSPPGMMMPYGGGQQPPFHPGQQGMMHQQGYGMQQQQQFQPHQGFGSMPPGGGGFGMQGQGMHQQQMGRGGPMQGGYPGFNQGYR